jgi:meso-butanediol dehydrogenase/(S,S)-butanediol dehydrogenase/diacetyl reductase
MTGRLDGKVAMITGTGGGQGRAAALVFAREGAKVVGCDVKVEGSRETVEMVRAAGGDMIALEPLDLTDEDNVKRWIDLGAKTYGGIDILYNNAASAKFGPMETMSLADWNFTMANEANVIFLAVKHAIPHFRARGGGSIINTASTVGLEGTRSGPGAIAHSAAKGAVVAMSNHMVSELASLNVRVNVIFPGAIDTPVLKDAVSIPEVAEAMTSANAIPRFGRPEEIAFAALYFASDESGFVTGANLIVDGGHRQGSGTNFADFDPTKWNDGRPAE